MCVSVSLLSCISASVCLEGNKGICSIFKLAMDLVEMLSVAEKTKGFNSEKQYGIWWRW